MEEELKQAFATQNIKLDKISQALYGDGSNPNQKGLVNLVSEHEIEIQSFRDFKSKGKLLWKLTVAGLTLVGYAVGKGFEHVVLHIEHLIFLFNQHGH
jgi:hypothetical protein